MKHFIYFLACTVFFLAACRKDHKEAAVPLSVTGFLPSSGNAGTVVTIRGTGFSRTLESNEVAFNGTAARVLSANDSMLVVQAPEKGTTGPLTVKNGDRNAQGGTYTYQALSIHNIAPANGPAGTNIYISGAGFTATDGPAEVTINGHSAVIANSNDTLLVAIVPADAGAGAVEVKVNGAHASGPSFVYQSITQIKPAKGGAGTKVTLTGTGFDQTLVNNQVAFNGVAATVISATATSMIVVAPDNVKTGPVSLTVNGQKTTGPLFTQVPVPAIKTVAPLSGPVGSTITIQGTDFSDITDEDSVYINGTATTILSATKSQLVVSVLPGTTTGTLRVVVNGQAVNGPQYAVQALGISQLLPDNGLAGTIIKISGTGFDPIATNNQVTINGLALVVNTASDSVLTATIPAGITTGTLQIRTGSLSATGPVFRRAGVSLFYKGPMVETNQRGMAIDSRGYIYVAAGNKIYRINPDGSGGTLFAGGDNSGNTDGMGSAAKFNGICGLAFDANDNLFVADGWNNSVRKITQAGIVTTFYSGLDNPARYIALDPAGNVYVGSEYSGTFRIAADGSQVKQMSRGGFSSQFTVVNGYIYWTNSDGGAIYRYNIVTGQAEHFAGTFFQSGYEDGPRGVGKMDGPGTLTYDPVSGQIYVIDGNNFSVRSISIADGTISTITGSGGTYEPWHSGNKDGTLQEALISPVQAGSMAVDKQGNIYIVEDYLRQIRKITLR
ncbi:IPT/TIG domain-containing protein [Chitinophaga qingshengii]|uniref:IPT/TIG domain-containing protein n=1 Tax=Chitinophaga qingshengii TaxID=1569794 RepID=A0ABR7TH60_9BACT|nr:IPT/TIG domain-containing protein [Chitinophaga qingshengii]MBC9929779.1 IPT/TIG domain-containing protein [Chitinophaga qingshengii]